MPNRHSKPMPKERILVVVEPHSDAARLLRAAKRRAEAHDISWEAAFIESSAVMRGLDLEDRERMQQAMTLAEQMGAIVTPLQTRTSLQTVLALLEERRRDGTPIGTIIIASSQKRSGLSKLQPSLAKQLKIKMASSSRITLITLGPEIIGTSRLGNLLQISPKEILYTLLVIVVATMLIEGLHYFWPDTITTQHRNKSIIYMIACTFSAVRFGMLAGMVAGVASFLAMGALYVTPIGSLLIDDANDAVSLGLFLSGALIVTLFASLQHDSNEELVKRGNRLQSLLRLHRVTLNHRSRADTISVLHAELKKLLKTDVAFFMPSAHRADHLEPLQDTDLHLATGDERALYAAWEDSKTTGIDTSYNPRCTWRFEPLLSSQGELGVLGVRIAPAITPDVAFYSLINGIADQVALILERLDLGHVAEETRIQAEREKLRAMLLSSVSHDLKTPLASVIGSLSVYRSMGKRLPEEQRMTLINTALDEAQRLDSFITNILDMTRIESGQIALKNEWIDPKHLMSEVIKRLRDRTRHHEVVIKAEEKPIEVMMDGMMTGQIIQNLIDNAAKYTPAGTRIDISWRVSGTTFIYEIRDHGPGIPGDQLESVFDKYTRLKRSDSQVAGTGLGLAIARAIMNVQGGTVTAANHPTGGAVFTLTLPQWREPFSGDRKVA